MESWIWARDDGDENDGGNNDGNKWPRNSKKGETAASKQTQFDLTVRQYALRERHRHNKSSGMGQSRGAYPSCQMVHMIPSTAMDIPELPLSLLLSDNGS
mmetsp:Transcript_1523/g.3779  ORF Transcript_1523/g.3779 Transcript_1523/m.3779 type:complete len:100 (+) Transcript_1523:779-1078(+)